MNQKYEVLVSKNYSRAAAELAAFAGIPETAPLAFPGSEGAAPLASDLSGSYRRWCPALPGQPRIGEVPRWLAWTMERTARRWLRAQRSQWGVKVLGIATDGKVVIHVYACARKAQRRMASLATGLAKRLAATARASDMAGVLGTRSLVLSWGWCPLALADQARRAAERARPKPAAVKPQPQPQYLRSQYFGWKYLLPA